MNDEIGSIDKPFTHQLQRRNQQIDKRFAIDNDIGVNRHPAHQQTLLLSGSVNQEGTRTLAR